MKTSNKLILGLFIITLVAIMGSNLILKAEYEKIDFGNIFYKYSKESLPPFTVIRLQGENNGLVQVQPADNFEIRISKREKNAITWEVRGDTLFFSFKSGRKPFYGDIFRVPPVAFILAPSLQAMHSSGVSSKLTGWKETDLTLTGMNSKMLLVDNSLKAFMVNLGEGSLLNIAAENQIQNANIAVSDTSALLVKEDIFQSLDIHTGDKAHISLPGGLFSKLVQE